MAAPRPLRAEHTIAVERTARYYTLGEVDGAINEIWFVLHGFSQLAGNFIQFFGDLVNRHRLVVAPEALNKYYVVQDTSVPAAQRQVGATWMTREDRENEIRDYARYLDRLHAHITANHPSARTIVLGFSQGGATASRWAIHGTAKIDRLIVWGATVPPDADLGAGANAFRGAPLSVVVGKTDQYVSAAAVAAERERLTAAGVRFDITEFDGGHSIRRNVLLEIAKSGSGESR